MKKHLVSIDDFTKNDLSRLLDRADEFRKRHTGTELRSKVVASLFFEPSTRTRLSFEAAVKYLGGSIIGFSSGTTSSTAKGESLEDTIRTVASYSDLIILRHPEKGSASRAAAVSNVPIINAGDGANEHPTQTLLDLYSIKRTQRNGMDNLHIGIAGDLKFGRTVHSLIKAMSHWQTSYSLMSPKQVRLPKKYRDLIKQSGGKYTERTSFGDLSDLDILYMTRTQRERFENEEEYLKVKGSLILKPKHLSNTKPSLRVLHPLPRVDEIDLKVDEHPAVYYFDQVRNGLFMRQALLADMLQH